MTNSINPDKNTHALTALDDILVARKHDDPASSYTASLYHKGLDAILKKVAEESAETIMAAKDVEHGADSSQLCYEACDLVYHLMVLLHHQGLTSADLDAELRRRFGLSGLAEKAARSRD